MKEEADDDLEERLLNFAARVVRFSESLPGTAAGRYLAGQVLRSGTAPMAHHGEAQAAESENDFIHKMKVAHKELRETIRWIRLAVRLPLVDDGKRIEPRIRQNDGLIRIFWANIKTAKQSEQ
ncbi:MAG: four helix bundle protein [Pseudoalteromonas tetraodonis]|jgi:four helix bundle protein